MKLVVYLVIIGLSLSCKKQKTIDCFPNSTTYRQVSNKQATIWQAPNGNFYIIEQGSIDIKLNPCNLPNEFRVPNLLITVSGDAKIPPPQVGPSTNVCCIEDFVITEINK